MLTEGSQLLKQGDYLWCVGYWQVLFVWLSFFSALQSKVTNLDLKAQDFDICYLMIAKVLNLLQD